MSDVKKMLNMDYMECINFLNSKYGNVSGDYFINEKCNVKNKNITRGKEGIYIHHVDEDKAIMLSTPAFAINNPFEYQKADRLVYCNLLEHLVLHIKIVEYPNPNQNKNELCGVGGIYNFIVPELNDIYSGINYKIAWKQKVIENVKPLKEDYLLCIKRLVEMNFEYPLLTSFVFNEMGGLWKKENNTPLFNEMKKIGVKF